jgi:hypothetical protein
MRKYTKYVLPHACCLENIQRYMYKVAMLTKRVSRPLLTSVMKR